MKNYMLITSPGPLGKEPEFAIFKNPMKHLACFTFFIRFSPQKHPLLFRTDCSPMDGLMKKFNNYSFMWLLSSKTQETTKASEIQSSFQK